MNNFSKQFTVTHVTIEVNVIEGRIDNYKVQLLKLQKEYDIWSQKKADIVREWSEDLALIRKAKGEPVDTICKDIILELVQMGMAEGGIRHIYNSVSKEYKRKYTLGMAFRDSNLKGITLETQSIEESVLEDLQGIEEKLQKLPDSRRNKLINEIEDFAKESHVTKKGKEGDFGIHQQEPPKEMQGESEFSLAIGETAAWFEKAALRYRRIESEVETYKPQSEERIKEMARDWNECMNDTLIEGILDPIFMLDTQAEADRKWSTSTYHWIGIIKNRIDQSKHGAGKMAENYICDPFGHIVYNKKGKPIKRGDTRERVGDIERPICDLAEKIIAANKGMLQLHDWLENDQGGHRRMRKVMLHEYFAEAATGSIKSGNPDYPEFMQNYKKKKREEYGLDETAFS